MKNNNHESLSDIEAAVTRWLEEVVIGLNLCPFAAAPQRKKQIRLVISESVKLEDLLGELQRELELLNSSPVDEIETTVLAIPKQLLDFYDYLDAVDIADSLLDEFDWRGKFQIASFHPAYQFSDTEVDDSENLTNRSPYPLLHLIREDSMEKAISSYPDTSTIPSNNIAKISGLSQSQKQQLFPYLFS